MLARHAFLLMCVGWPAVGLAQSGGEAGSSIRLSTPGTAALSSPAAVSPKPTPEVPAASLPVRDVTVYSDRARVVRAGEVSIGGGVQRLLLPRLPATLDPQSVRLEASGASLKRVEVVRADRDEFPRGEAEQLLEQMEKARDTEAALADAHEAIEGERDLLQSLRPSTSPGEDSERPPALLEPAGWQAALAFIDARVRADDDLLRGIEKQRRDAAKVTQQLVARAAQLSVGANAQPGYKVEAILEGRGGPAKLTLTYVAWNARWYPAYDLRFSPETSLVEIDFVGLVSQQTGEDWEQARLVLSTAVPATTVALPKLMSWKIGDRDRFIPVPEAQPEPYPAQSSPAPVRATLQPDGLEDLRVALSRAINQPVDRDLAEKDLEEAGDLGQGTLGADSGDVGGYGKGYGGVASKSDSSRAPYPAAPPPGRRSIARDEEDERVYPAAEVTAERSAPSAISGLFNFGGDDKFEAPAEAVGFGVPRGWAAPAYAADLPAALAGGYDFVYASARPESVKSGGEARRVALHRTKMPAKAVVTILPALRKQAYLVADVTNQSDRPLLRGNANLYVGADLQGQALIETTAVGEKVTLPLGVDEAIRVERQVNVVDGEKGVISKDDVTRYEVVIELLNPRKAQVEARIVDQIPLKGDENVEIKLDKTEPWAIQRKEEGQLEWHIPLPPGQKKVVSFSYTVTRPRGAKLRQW